MKKKTSYVNFSLGNACNLRCKFCYNDEQRNDKQYYKDIKILKAELLKYNFIGKKTINLIGGEPLFYPDIFELLDFLEKNNFIVNFITNGVRFSDKDFIIKFQEYKNINIRISIHSHSSYLEDKISSRKGIFSKKMKAIKNLKKYNFDFQLSLVINNYNLNYLLEIINFYRENFNKLLSLQGMLGDGNISEINIKSIPNYTKILKKLNDLKDKSISSVHFIPLCIHFSVKKIVYSIRELQRKFLFSSTHNGTYLFEKHLKKNFIGDKCKKCFSLGKFCFGPGKGYVKKYGYNEFSSLSKKDVIKLIKISNKNV